MSVLVELKNAKMLRCVRLTVTNAYEDSENDANRTAKEPTPSYFLGLDLRFSWMDDTSILHITLDVPFSLLSSIISSFHSHIQISIKDSNINNMKMIKLTKVFS